MDRNSGDTDGAECEADLTGELTDRISDPTSTVLTRYWELQGGSDAYGSGWVFMLSCGDETNLDVPRRTIKVMLSPESTEEQFHFGAGTYEIAPVRLLSEAPAGTVHATLDVAESGEWLAYEGSVQITEFSAERVQGTFEISFTKEREQDRSITAVASFDAACNTDIAVCGG